MKKEKSSYITALNLYVGGLFFWVSPRRNWEDKGVRGFPLDFDIKSVGVFAERSAERGATGSRGARANFEICP